MKIALAGDFNFYIYQESVSQALERQGHTVFRIPLGSYIKRGIGKNEYYFSWRGIIATYYNLKIIYIILKEKVDVLWCWRSTLIFDFTLKLAKRLNVKLISYNNDNPFSQEYQKGNFHQKRLWVHFKRQIPIYDINFVYRPSNLVEYENLGSRKTFVWPPAFLKENVIEEIPFEFKTIDVIFIGHYEEFREECIKYLIENNINVEVFGGKWEMSNLEYKTSIKPIHGLEYYEKIKKSKIALAFLSRLNEDTYTRRNFEIPACRTVMVSERTEDLINYFEEGKEAIFFSNKEELRNKVAWILSNNSEMKEISEKGYRRVFESGYDLDSRVRQLVNIILTTL